MMIYSHLNFCDSSCSKCKSLASTARPALGKIFGRSLLRSIDVPLEFISSSYCIQCTISSSTAIRDLRLPLHDNNTMTSLRSRTSPWRQTFERLTATAAPVRPATRSFAPRSRTMSTFPSSSSGSSSSGSSSGSRSGFRLTPTTAVLCCVPILTAYLGVWQVQRLKWKLGLIADVDRNLSKDPMVLPNEIK
jgi:hypothetical protein